MNLGRAISGFLLSFVFLSVFVYIVFDVQCFWESFPSPKNEVVLGSVAGVIKNVAENIGPPEINAGSAISVEGNFSGVNKIIFEKSANEKLPIASLTKLMAAIVVLDNYDLSKNITVSQLADSQPPMRQDIKLGDTMPIESFLDIMLIESSNRSAYTLAELMGVQKFTGLMNKKVKDLDLENTFFADPAGLSNKNVSTAKDLAKLAEHILKNYPKIAEISRVRELDVPGFGKAENTDQLLGEVPEAVCSKTGFTTEAKGCLLLVTNNPQNNGYIINIILGADDRFSEMRKLINYDNSNF